MKHEIKPSSAQTEVWLWKEQATQSLLALPPELWLKTIHTRTQKAMLTIKTLKKNPAKKLRRVVGTV
jgi:hypothetical protein